MAIYEMGPDELVLLERTSFTDALVTERGDLQRLIRQQIDVIVPDTLVIAEEFCDWEDSRRRVDLLGIDNKANLVVIELKRTEDGGHMELQAIRYAAMVSALTFEQVVNAFERYLISLGRSDDARQKLLDFLGWEEPDEENFAQNVRIILASADFSKEITTSVLWLNDRGLDIRCVRLRPYRDRERILLDVQQVIPLPEAEEYQIRIQDKVRLERVARKQARDLTRYNVVIGDEKHTGLPKRRAIFYLIRHLCTSGVDPEAIRAIIAWKSWALRDVPGTLDSSEFIPAMRKQLISKDLSPDAVSRMYVGNDELIYANGRTYGVTKMWGARTAEAMQLLVDNFSDKGISFEESA